MREMLRLRAGQIRTGQGQFLGNHDILIAAGRISAVVPRAASAQGRLVDLGSALLLPGLVNCHTHLGHSRWEANGHTGYAALSAMSSRRSGQSAAERLSQYIHGLALARAAGLTTVATTVNPEDAGLLRDMPLRESRLFAWLTVKDRHTEDQVRHAAGLLTDLVADGGLAGVGLLLHSFYALSPERLTPAVSLARAQGWPVSVHLAELAEEADWVYRGRGGSRVGIAMARHGCGQRGFAGLLDHYGLLAPGLVAVHCGWMRGRDLSHLLDAGAHLVLCPRTNLLVSGRMAAFPAADIRWQHQLSVATDGLSTAGRFDLFEECDLALRHLMACGSLVSAQLCADYALDLITSGPARALGLSDGGLAPGSRADLVALRVPGWSRDVSCTDLLSTIRAADIVATVSGGHLTWRDSDTQLTVTSGHV